MSEENGEFPVKKLIILIVLVGVLILILLPPFTSKSKSKASPGATSAQGSALTKRPLPPNFDKLPPKLQERLRKRFQPAA